MTSNGLKIVTQKADDTVKLAAGLGRRLKGGEVVELISDLGGGKTTFVKGLAEGIGYEGLVSSPSFTISHDYKALNLTLYHFDFYRLSDPGIMLDELAETLKQPDAVVVIEWPMAVENILPSKRLTVRITVLDEDKREISFDWPPGLSYLVEGL